MRGEQGGGGSPVVAARPGAYDEFQHFEDGMILTLQVILWFGSAANSAGQDSESAAS